MWNTVLASLAEETEAVWGRSIAPANEEPLAGNTGANSESPRVFDSEAAWILVERMITLHLQLLQDLPHLHDLSLLASDDLVALAERLLWCCHTFRQADKPATITLGYHYTDESNIQSIREQNLLSLSERRLNHVGPLFGGTLFGDGIYFANNPVAFNHFGDTGMLVAIVKGDVSWYSDSADTDTVIGNRMRNPYAQEQQLEFWDETVVKATNQCLPLLVFSKPENPEDGFCFLNQLWVAHCQLQACLDELFNSGTPTELYRVLPPEVYSEQVERERGMLQRHYVFQHQSQGQTHPSHIFLPRPPQSIEEFLNRHHWERSCDTMPNKSYYK